MRWSWESFGSGLLVGALIAGLLWIVVGETDGDPVAPRDGGATVHADETESASSMPIDDELDTAVAPGRGRAAGRTRVDPRNIALHDVSGADEGAPPPLETGATVTDLNGRLVVGSGDGGTFRISFKGGDGGWVRLIAGASQGDPAPELLRWSQRAARDAVPGDTVPSRADVAARLSASSYAERAVGVGLATRARPVPIDLLLSAARDADYPDLRGASLLAAFEASRDSEDVRAAILDLALDGDIGARRTAIGLLGQMGSAGGDRAAEILLSGDYTSEILDQLCGAVAHQGDVAAFLAGSPSPDAAASVMKQLASRLAMPRSDDDQRLLEALPQLVRPLLESVAADRHAPLVLPHLAARGHGAFLRGVAVTPMYRDAVRIAAVNAALGQDATRADGIAATASILTDPSTTVALARGVLSAVDGHWTADATLRGALDAAARSHPSAWVRAEARDHLAKHDPTARGTVVIHDAAYGAGDGWVDVTEQLRAAVSAGRLRIQASNEIAGDPKVGVGKSLRVEYSLDGERRLRTVGEGRWLTIP